MTLRTMRILAFAGRFLLNSSAKMTREETVALWEAIKELDTEIANAEKELEEIEKL